MRSITMTYPAYLRLRARELRVSRQLTLDELVERLALPRSTVYQWIKDLPLERPRDSSAAQRKGTRAMQAKYRCLREDAYQRGVDEYPGLVLVPTFRDFVVLYIAEGYKRCRNVVSIGNSDPEVVRLAAHWLGSLASRDLRYALQYHADQDPPELTRFWAQTLGFDGEKLRLQRKSNSGQLTGRIWRSEHGVLTVSVSETLLRARLQAWIDLTRAGWR